MDSPSCCCVMLKPKYKKIVHSMIHMGNDEKSSKSNEDKLIFHVSNKNEDFDGIGEYTRHKFHKHYRKKHYEVCLKCLEVFKCLSVTAGSECLINHIMEVVEVGIKSKDMKLNHMAVKTFFDYCRDRSANIFNYPDWRNFLDVFYNYCLTEDSNPSVQQAFRKCGLIGIYGIIHSSVINVTRQIENEELSKKIIVALMKNLSQNPVFSNDISEKKNPSWKFNRHRRTFTASCSSETSFDSFSLPRSLKNSANNDDTLKNTQQNRKANTNASRAVIADSILIPDAKNQNTVVIGDRVPVNAQYEPWKSKNDVLSEVVFKQFLFMTTPATVNVVINRIFQTIKLLCDWNNHSFACYVFSTVCESIEESLHRNLFIILMDYLKENRSDNNLVSHAVSLITDCIQYILINVIIGVIGSDVVDHLLDLFITADPTEIELRENILNALSTFASHLQSSLMNEPMERIIARIPLPEECNTDAEYLLTNYKLWQWNSEQKENSLNFLICLKAIVQSSSNTVSFTMHQMELFARLQNGFLYPCEKCREVLLKIIIIFLDHYKNVQTLISMLRGECGPCLNQNSKLKSPAIEDVALMPLLEFNFTLFFHFVRISFILPDNRKTHYRSLALILGILAGLLKTGGFLAQLSRALFVIQEDIMKQYINASASEGSENKSSCSGISRSTSTASDEYFTLVHPQEKFLMSVPKRYAYIHSAITAALLFISYSLGAQELVDLCEKAVKKRQEHGLYVMCPLEVFLEEETRYIPTDSTQIRSSFNASSLSRDGQPVTAITSMNFQQAATNDDSANEASTNTVASNTEEIYYLSRSIVVEPKSFLSALKNLGIADAFKTERSTFKKGSTSLFPSTKYLNKSGESIDKVRNKKDHETLEVTYFTLKDAANTASTEYEHDTVISPFGSSSFEVHNLNTPPNFTETINQIGIRSHGEDHKDSDIDELLDNDENHVPSESIFTF